MSSCSWLWSAFLLSFSPFNTCIADYASSDATLHRICLPASIYRAKVYFIISKRQMLIPFNIWRSNGMHFISLLIVPLDIFKRAKNHKDTTNFKVRLHCLVSEAVNRTGARTVVPMSGSGYNEFGAECQSRSGLCRVTWNSRFWSTRSVRRFDTTLIRIGNYNARILIWIHCDDSFKARLRPSLRLVRFEVGVKNYAIKSFRVKGRKPFRESAF